MTTIIVCVISDRILPPEGLYFGLLIGLTAELGCFCRSQISRTVLFVVGSCRTMPSQSLGSLMLYAYKRSKFQESKLRSNCFNVLFIDFFPFLKSIR